MSSIGTGYDLSASTFSPDGRIFQVEYAMKAIDSSGTAIALRGKNCVVMAVEKIITSKLYERTSNCRITNVDRHIGFASAGVYPDARALAKYCEETAMDYRIEYGTPCPLEHLADTLANYMHAYTLYSAVRPFGAAVLLSSWSKVDGSQLYMVDPAGLGYAYHGCAMGKAKQAAKTEIEKLKLLEMTPEELLKQAARIIYATRDETKDKNFELELSWVGANTDGKHLLVPAEISGPIVSEARRLVEDVDDDEEMAAEPTA